MAILSSTNKQDKGEDKDGPTMVDSRQSNGNNNQQNHNEKEVEHGEGDTLDSYKPDAHTEAQTQSQQNEF